MSWQTIFWQILLDSQPTILHMGVGQHGVRREPNKVGGIVPGRAHLLLHMRTQVPDEDWGDMFRTW